jgi:protease I
VTCGRAGPPRLERRHEGALRVLIITAGNSPPMPGLSTIHVACLATEGFEWAELVEPVKALRDAGAVVDIISQERGPVQGFKHHDRAERVTADLTFAEAKPDRYDALLLPGGVINADTIRTIREAREFVKAFDRARKPMAVICHAPWLLISAGVAKGRTLTSYFSIQDDLRNAGADWLDREVVIDGNLVTSRSPDDLPAFNREMLALFAQHSGRSTGAGSDTTTSGRQGVRA